MMKQADGTWTGVAAELWAEVARREKLEWRFVEGMPDSLLAGLLDGSLDVVALPMVPTLERERVMDFTYGWYRTGLGIAVKRPSESRRWLSLGRTLLSAGYLQVFGTLLLSLGVAGLVVWRFEKRANPDHFGPGLRLRNRARCEIAHAAPRIAHLLIILKPLNQETHQCALLQGR